MKQKLSLLVLLLLCLGNGVQAQRPRVGVALSGGGAKGVAHIGALRVIEEAGIPIDYITGTSMGALVGALYSMGYSTDFLDSLFTSQDWISLLSDRTDPSTLALHQRQEQNTYQLIRGLSNEQPERGGLIRGRNIMRMMRTLCAHLGDSISFDSLPIPFACVATNIVDNTEVDLHSGSLPKAMRASMSIPGVFTPVRWGDSVLIDGGLQNNLPVDLARQMGADIVISVSVQTPLLTADQITDASSVISQIIDINCKRKFYENIASSDIFIHVDVSGFSSTSYSNTAMHTLVTRGEEAARQQWESLLKLRDDNGLEATARQTRTMPIPDEGQQPTRTRTTTRIPIASAGFRFDSEEMASMQLNLKTPLHIGIPMGASATLRLGKRIMARAELLWLTNHTGFNPTVSYTFRHNDLDIYDAGSRTYSIRYHQHTADFSPLDLRRKKFDIHAGIRWDYYNYSQLLSATSYVAEPTDAHYFTYYFSADHNNENHWYFPTRGFRFHSALLYHTDNLYGYDGNIGIADAQVHWSGNIPISSHWALQALAYGRAVVADSVPWAYLNGVGGDQFAHYVEQQMPFAGVGHIELADNYMAAVQLQLQCQLLPKHYLQLRTAVGYHTNQFDTFDKQHILAGVQGVYNYDSFMGPLSLAIGYSNLSRNISLYLNLGHKF